MKSLQRTAGNTAVASMLAVPVAGASGLGGSIVSQQFVISQSSGLGEVSRNAARGDG